jgi:hypothetical protein
MAWSITNYDTLHILYTDIYGNPHIIRKDFTQFYILYQGEDAIEMCVTSGYKHLNHNTWLNQAIPPQYGLTAGYTTNTYTQTLYYTEASTPVATSAQDMLNQLYALLQVDSDLVVEKNGTLVGQRPKLNFIEGANVTITALDNPVNTRIDVTINSLGGGGVTTFDAGTTGFNPVGATSGAITLSGTLNVANGGTGATSLTGVLVGTGITPITAIVGTSGQLLRRNIADTAYEFFSPGYLTSAITSLNGLTVAVQTFVNDTNVTITSAGSTHTLGWSGTLPISRGGTGLSTVPTNGQLLIGNGTGYTLSTLTAGPGISVTNAAGSITINNTGVTDDPFPKILMMMGG